ncbi:MAG: branched-chain amino acid ABC transporter permease [Hyphomicrobiales bacterium]|nr:branched-chain amino acid ABC transporter permease [Hyphomicrobiales bacterium]MCP4999977.1 branched-chain amino acid ABC transporter permease [Hyphomicrobiales bacterium]
MSATANYTVVRFSTPSRIAAVAAIVILIVLACAPLWAGRADMRLLSELFLYMALASLWNLLAGYAGLVSVGQQAFVGFGGYCLFGLTIFFGLSPLAAVPIAGLAGALVSVPVAVLIFRLRGAYFAIGTWVIAEVFRLTAAQVSSLGGGSGTSLPVAIVKSIADSRAMREATTYWMALGIVLLVLVLVCVLLRSRRGIALTAIRDNELASQSLGIDIWRAKFFVYVITGGLTAAVGALIFLQKLRISPDAAFSVNDWTAFVIFIVVIGGIGTIEGPIIGTIIFFLLRETLADLGALYLMILGLVAIVIMLRAPKGIWGFVRQKTGFDLFALSRRVIATHPDRRGNNTDNKENAHEPQAT